MFIPTLILFQSQFAPLNHKPLPKPKTEFTFVAMGDNRPAGAGLPPTATYRELLKEISIIDPDFVLSTGDLLYGNEESLDQYKTEVKWIKPLLDTVPCPFFNVPGNHEVDNKPEFIAEYRASLGPLYGRFDFGGYRFLAVCTELAGERAGVTGDVLTWLKGEMATPKPTFVFEHHPVFKRPTNPEEGSTVEGAQALHELYVAGGVKAVFEGHDHVFDTQEHDGIAYTIAGGAGAPLDADPTQGGFFHFVLVHVSGDKIEQTVIPLGAIEITPLGDGKAAAADYADADLTVSNLQVESSFRPNSVSASYSTKKGKGKAVEARLLAVEKRGNGFVARVSLTLPKHRATMVTLNP